MTGAHYECIFYLFVKRKSTLSPCGSPRQKERSFAVSTLMPKGEKLRQAIKWISSELKENTALLPEQLIPQASEKFNLSPKEEEFLVSFYGKGKLEEP